MFTVTLAELVTRCVEPKTYQELLAVFQNQTRNNAPPDVTFPKKLQSALDELARTGWLDKNPDTQQYKAKETQLPSLDDKIV